MYLFYISMNKNKEEIFSNKLIKTDIPHFYTNKKL